MQPENIRTVRVKDITIEDGAMEAANSSSMEPYLDYIQAKMTGRRQEEARRAIADLPLERRYLWRIASSLKQAFVDFDKASVRFDLTSMNAADFDYIVGLIERRPVQFAMLLRTIFGAEEMERMLLEAIDIAKG
jgi:hypothetical protein